MSDVAITDNREDHRIEGHVDGELAGVVEYRERSGHRVLLHTVVEPAFGGQGIGGTLARAALDLARADGTGVVVLCPFIQSWLEKHPEYADLVVEASHGDDPERE